MDTNTQIRVAYHLTKASRIIRNLYGVDDPTLSVVQRLAATAISRELEAADRKVVAAVVRRLTEIYLMVAAESDQRASKNSDIVGHLTLAAGLLGVKFEAAAPSPDAPKLWGVWERPDEGLTTPRGRVLASCGERPAHGHPVAVGLREGDHVRVPAAQLEALAQELDQLYAQIARGGAQ